MSERFGTTNDPAPDGSDAIALRKGLPPLDLALLKSSATAFVRDLSGSPLPQLYGVTDGKAVGTYVEAGFHQYLGGQYAYVTGNAASGIDFPGLSVDVKVTSVRQPQSSSPFRDATQKVYGLGYHLLLFVYEKVDDRESHTAALKINHTVFIPEERTADFQTTSGIAEILDRNGNVDDVDAFLQERNLPLDEIGRRQLAERILTDRPAIGYLTVSNALQWRLQYGRVVQLVAAGQGEGLEDLLA
jgi:restriction system protein